MDMERELAQVADKYRCEGYRVMLHPGAGDVPSFAEGQAVDLLAQKGEEKVLVRVKANREDLRDDQGLLRLAELVDQQPEWRLDLVVLNRDAPAYQVAPDATEPPLEQIEQSLAHAEQVSVAGELQLSCVLSWAALEAAMRRTARAAGIGVKDASPSYLLRALYAEGFLYKQEFDRLDDVMKIRNAIVHGMMLPAISPTIPQDVASVARRLLSANGIQPVP